MYKFGQIDAIKNHTVLDRHTHYDAIFSQYHPIILMKQAQAVNYYIE